MIKMDTQDSLCVISYTRNAIRKFRNGQYIVLQIKPLNIPDMRNGMQTSAVWSSKYPYMLSLQCPLILIPSVKRDLLPLHTSVLMIQWEPESLYWLNRIFESQNATYSVNHKPLRVDIMSWDHKTIAFSSNHVSGLNIRLALSINLLF